MFGAQIDAGLCCNQECFSRGRKGRIAHVLGHRFCYAAEPGAANVKDAAAAKRLNQRTVFLQGLRLATDHHGHVRRPAAHRSVQDLDAAFETGCGDTLKHER